MSDQLVVPLKRLLAERGSLETLHLVGEVETGAITASRLVDPCVVDVEVNVEAHDGGISVVGSAQSRWSGECVRCLEPCKGSIDAEFREVVVAAGSEGASDDAFTYQGSELNLGPLVREALVLALPTLPICREDCRGLCPTCGANRNTDDCGHAAAISDDRWSALDGLMDQLLAEQTGPPSSDRMADRGSSKEEEVEGSQ